MSGSEHFEEEKFPQFNSHDSEPRHDQHDADQLLVPSAPPSSSSSDDNGYIVVPPTPQTSVEQSAASSEIKSIEEINKVLSDIIQSADQVLTARGGGAVFAEADSSTSSSARDTLTKKDSSSSSCSASSLCPYYFLALNYAKNIEIPPKVKDLLLWSDPKLSGAVFGTTFVLLISLSLFSFLTVISSLLLLLLSLIGSYRFYLALVFRIKGVHDQTFDKLSEFDVTLPKDKVKQLAHLLEADINKVLKQLKSIILWDNLTQSALSLVGLYFVYCIGSVFNTLTLLNLTLVGLFTLPKVYQVYQQPIDQAVESATNSAHLVVRQVMAKVPFLNKKKNQ